MLRHSLYVVIPVVVGNLLLTTARAADLPPASHAAPPPSGERVEALVKESNSLNANDPQKAIALAREALAMAQGLRDQAAELRARARLGEALRIASSYDEARTVIDAGLALPFGEEERASHTELVYLSGQVFWNNGDYAEAEHCYIDAQRAAEALGDRRLVIRSLNSRGIVARHENELAQSSTHFRAALALAEVAGENDLRLQILNNLALLLIDQGNWPEARTLLQTNLSLHTAANNRRGMANALINLGTVETAAHDYAAALDYGRRALAIRLETGVPRQIAGAQISVASTLARLGRGQEALDYLRAAAPAVEKVASHEMSGNLYAAFSAAYESLGDFRAALDYQHKAEKENGAVVGEKTAVTVTELGQRFAAEKRQREIVELRADQEKKAAELALNEAELRRTRLERYGLAALLLLGGIAVTAIISRQRTQARANGLILGETRRARDAAEQAHALKTRLLDLASHDLKSPLIGMMLTADGIADETGDRPAVAANAHRLKVECQRMFDLVQHLLDTSALEAGKLVLQCAPLDLSAVVRTSLDLLQPQAARKSQTIAFTADAGDACRIDGDAARLRQVVENLVSNGLKFSPGGATIRVTVKRAKGVRLEVRDEGPGLSAADQQGLFQRFQRLSAAPTGGEASTGLGLSLAHDLVALHGGRLWVESTPGSGATFTADFPATAREI